MPITSINNDFQQQNRKLKLERPQPEDKSNSSDYEAYLDRSKVSVSVNDFRRQERLEPVEKQRSGGKEISITFKPWRLVRFLVVIALFVSVFYLGRWTADPSLSLFESSSKTTTAAVVKDTIKDTTTESKAAAPAAPAEKTEEKAAPPSAPSSATGAAVAEPKTESAPETIITKYTKVALATTAVTLDWRDTWGKITQLSFTVKNNEAGTIKPSYFIMNLEGYDDFDKKIDLPRDAQTIKAGQKLEAKVNVPNGFAYSSVTAGDLSTVKVLVTLYDEKGTVITAYEREFNLNGAAK